ncbi:MAG: hypothetical protein AAFZ52_19025, partial [Bacteroidota bacterium]
MPLFFILVVACTQTIPGKPIVNRAEDERLLRQLKEELWPTAYAEQDTLLLDRILGEDFQMIDQAGNWYEKADELAWIK